MLHLVPFVFLSQPRPANLPPKSLEEEQKHRQLYEEMVQEAKRRELKDAKMKRKQVTIEVQIPNTKDRCVEL